MKISTKGRYGLRIMLDLALAPRGEYVSIKSIASRQSISEKYMEQIVTTLNRAGFADLGVKERPGLVVLNQTRMPAVLVEAGFINSEDDNRFFDSHFEEIAAAVADGILAGIQAEEASEPEYYQVQTGSYRNQNLASQQLAQLRSQGFPSFLVYQDGFYKVRTGAFLNLDNAARMERELRRYGYSTWLIREKAVE